MFKTFVGFLIIFIYLKLSYGLDRGLDSSTLRPSTTVRPLSEKFITKNNNNNHIPIDGVIKRNIKVEDIAKTFEPSQEFNRPTNYDRDRDGFGGSSRTFSGPSTNYGYDNRYPPKAGLGQGIGTVYSTLTKSKSGLLERIGVGQNSFSNSLGNSDRYGGTSDRYGGSSDRYAGSSDRYGGSGYSSYGSPPLDYSYGQGSYGNDYNSEYGSSSYGSNNQDIILQKIAFAKKVLLPIAGVAALGIAAAYIVNPLLFQAGSTAAGTPFGKRRRRDLSDEQNYFQKKLNSQNLAYKNYKK